MTGSTSLKILVADDHRAFGSLVSTILRASVTRAVSVVQTVEAALEQLDQNTPDVLLTDLRFGADFGGLELIGAVRGHKRFEVQVMPILVISANTDLATVRRAQALGVTQFLSKPITPALLVRRLAMMTEAAASTLQLPGEAVQL